MFINCKHCGSLVATDPATDLPPARCPRCRGVLRGDAELPPQVSVARLLRPSPPDDDDGVPGAVAGPQPVDPAPLEPAPQPTAEAASVPGMPAPREPDTRDDAQTPVEAMPSDATPAPVDRTVVDATPVRSVAPQAARGSPSFARRVAAPPLPAHARRQQRVLGVLAAALTLTLVLQILLADRARLARDPQWRGALTQLCAALRCSLPPWREPDALTVLARDVRPDAAGAGRLVASATFRNDARWAQAWPRMRLTLSDIDGRAVGSRVFTVEEYLGAPPGTATLAPGSSAQARLHLVEPDTRAVSFAFDFL